MEIKELDLTSIDHVLTTTRAVRRRIDVTRPVDPAILKECIDIAVQAPSGLHGETWHFLVITDPDKRTQIADIYKRAALPYVEGADVIPDDYLAMVVSLPGAERPEQVNKIVQSTLAMTEHMDQVPVFILACVEGRMEDKGPGPQASQYASIFPAVWSLQLSLRARGLGSALTTIHIAHEDEVAKAFDIPPGITQACLLPVGYFTGKDFRRAQRKPSESCTHWNSWIN